MRKHKKVSKVIINAFQFCWPYIILNVLIVSITTIVALSINFINKDIINQLSYDTLQGELSAAFVGLVLMYAFCFLFQKISGFLGALGYNFYQLKVEQFFQDVFNWKSFKCNQEKFFETEFLEQYSFAQKGIKRVSSHILNSYCNNDMIRNITSAQFLRDRKFLYQLTYGDLNTVYDFLLAKDS